MSRSQRIVQLALNCQASSEGVPSVSTQNVSKDLLNQECGSDNHLRSIQLNEDKNDDFNDMQIDSDYSLALESDDLYNPSCSDSDSEDSVESSNVVRKYRVGVNKKTVCNTTQPDSVGCVQSENENNVQPDNENNNVQSENENNIQPDHLGQADVPNQVVYDISVNKVKKRKKAEPKKWKRNVVKQKRMSGQEYVNRGGKVVLEKKPLNVNCSRCRYHCEDNFSENLRFKICSEYWNMGDSVKQKIFLSSLIQDVPVRRQNLNTAQHRKLSRVFYLPAVGGKKLRVCRNFFCKTFSISSRIVEYGIKEKSETGLYVGTDKRSGKVPSNLTSDSDIVHVKEHINSFPRMESHYCRRDSSKVYLSADLNLSAMYRMYKEYCSENSFRPVSLFVYQSIFHKYDPELAFYAPKKDQCPLCNIYSQASDKEPIKESWDEHKKREKDSMEMKTIDKERSQKDETFRSISFDLQAILSVPYAADNQLYYKRKLNVFNFTIFDAHNNDGYCYVWDECNGSKGSSEVGTCLLKYLEALPETVTHVASFSDTCGGQNRNKYVAGAMLYGVCHIGNLQTIDLKFMESGHSYLEADSMHATIERARKHKKIYTTREWALLISHARIKPRPYKVSTLTFSEFRDLHQLSSRVLQNTTVDTSGDRVQWLKIKWLRFEKSKPHVIQFKYDLCSPLFLEINIFQKRRATEINWSEVTLKQKYDKLIPLSEEKKKDLIDLLKSGIIPPDYKYFIDSLPSLPSSKKSKNPHHISDYESD